MVYRRLGRSGLQVSAISLGAWATIGEALGRRETARLLDGAYELGINFFDNAETYGNGDAERAMGRAIAKLKWPRETFLLSSKVFWGTGSKAPTARGLNRKHIVEACNAALSRLQVDYLDLYLCHRRDPDTPLLETVRAMSDLITGHGKVLYWGTSEWPATDIVEAHRIASEEGLVPPSTEQAQYNLFVREKVEAEYEAAGLYRSLGLGLMVWSPLAYGLLAGRYNGSGRTDGRISRPGFEWLRDSLLGTEREQRLAAARDLAVLASEHGMTPAQMSIAWVLRNPNVSTAITGASSLGQLRDTVGALQAVPLTMDAVDGLDQIFLAEGRE
jgi:voltage-dependent potassium channel beta subunit